MTLTWKTCAICNGYGEIQIRKTRVQKMFEKLKNKEPIIDDEMVKCPNCNGKGKTYVKANMPFNPWNPFRKDK